MTKLDVRRIFYGDVYRDLSTGKEMTVEKIEGDLISFDDGTNVPAKKLESLFKFLKRGNKVYASADDFEIKNEKLLYKGEEIKGTLKFEEPLCAYEDKMLFKIKSGEKHTVVAYSIKDDTFASFSNVLESDEVKLLVVEPIPVLLFINDNEDGSVSTKLVKFVGTDYLILFQDTEEWVLDENCVKVHRDFTDGSGKQHLFFTSNMKNVEDVKEKEDEPTHFHQEEVDDTLIIQLDIFVEKDEDGKIIQYSLALLDVNVVRGKVQGIQPHYDDAYVVKTDDGIICCRPNYVSQYFEGEDVLKAYETHPILVEVIIGRSGVHNVVRLKDENNDIARIHREDTRDRGSITEVLSEEN